MGTAINNVVTPSAMQSHTTLASNRGSMRHAAPDHNAQESTLMIPWTWCSGKHSTMRSSPDHSQACTSVLICAVCFVRGDHAFRFAGGPAGVENHGAPRACDGWQFCRRVAGRLGSGEFLVECAHLFVQAAGAANGWRSGAYAASKSTVDARVSSIRNSNSGFAELHGNGTAMPPARQMPIAWQPKEIPESAETLGVLRASPRDRQAML